MDTMNLSSVSSSSMHQSGLAFQVGSSSKSSGKIATDAVPIESAPVESTQNGSFQTPSSTSGSSSSINLIA